MSYAQGFKTSMRIGEEVSFGAGAPVSANAWKFPIIKPGLKGQQNLIESKALLDDPNPRTPVSGNRMSTGSTELEVSPLSIGWIYKWLLGSATTTSAGTGTAYLINNGAGYAAGATTLVVDGGSGTIPVNTWVSIGGYSYRVNTQVGGATVTSITIDGGLVAAVLDNAPITVSTNKGHKFNLANAVQQSLFAEVSYSDVSSFEEHLGVVVDKCAFKFTPEGLMAVTVDMEGQNFSFADATVVSGTLTSPSHTPFSYFGAQIVMGGVAQAVIKSLDFTVDRMVDKNQFVIGPTGTRGSLPSGIAKIDGTMKVLYTGNTLSKLADAGTPTDIRATLRNGALAMSLWMPEVRLEVTTASVASEAVVEQDIPFKAYYNTNSEATSFQACISNSNASYASM